MLSNTASPTREDHLANLTYWPISSNKKKLHYFTSFACVLKAAGWINQRCIFLNLNNYLIICFKDHIGFVTHIWYVTLVSNIINIIRSFYMWLKWWNNKKTTFSLHFTTLLVSWDNHCYNVNDIILLCYYTMLKPLFLLPYIKLLNLTVHRDRLHHTFVVIKSTHLSNLLWQSDCLKVNMDSDEWLVFRTQRISCSTGDGATKLSAISLKEVDSLFWLDSTDKQLHVLSIQIKMMNLSRTHMASKLL